MIKLKSLIKEELTFESPDESSVNFYSDLNRIEKESGINILSDKNLLIVAIKDEKCVGALYTGFSNKEFSFDIIVDKNERNQGIGDNLFKIGMAEYHSVSDEYHLKLDVVNPYWVNHHLKRGLKIVNKIGNHTIMSI